MDDPEELSGFNRLMRRITKALGLDAANAIAKDPYNASIPLEDAHPEAVNEVKNAAAEARENSKPNSKLWIGAGIIFLCAVVVMGNRQIKRHFSMKERGERDQDQS